MRPGPGSTLLSPDSGGDDFSSKEGAEDSSSLGGEEPKDRERGDGSLVQIWRIKMDTMNGGGEIIPGLIHGDSFVLRSYALSGLWAFTNWENTQGCLARWKLGAGPGSYLGRPVPEVLAESI